MAGRWNGKLTNINNDVSSPQGPQEIIFCCILLECLYYTIISLSVDYIFVELHHHVATTLIISEVYVCLISEITIPVLHG